MKWFSLMREGTVGMLREVQSWEDLVVYLIIVPMLSPIVAVVSVGVGMIGLARLIMDPETYQPLSDRIFALVLLFYGCVGVVVITGAYIAIDTFFKRLAQ